MQNPILPKLKIFNLLIFIALCILSCSHGELARSENVLYGRVVGVHDGDTVTLLSGHSQTRIRLTEIDAPESRQAFGSKAKQALSDLIFNKEVKVLLHGKDHYGRTLGRIYLGNLDVSREMIRQGYAWAYRQYLTDKSLLKVEEEARNARRGIWSQPNPVPPWEFRKKK